MSDYQVKCLQGNRTVSEMSNIEREVLLTDIVQRCYDKDFFDQIGAEVFDCLVDAELLSFEGEEDGEY